MAVSERGGCVTVRSSKGKVSNRSFRRGFLGVKCSGEGGKGCHSALGEPFVKEGKVKGLTLLSYTRGVRVTSGGINRSIINKIVSGSTLSGTVASSLGSRSCVLRALDSRVLGTVGELRGKAYVIFRGMGGNVFGAVSCVGGTVTLCFEFSLVSRRFGVCMGNRLVGRSVLGSLTSSARFL